MPQEARVQHHRHRVDLLAVPRPCSTPRRAGSASVPHQADCKNCHTFHGSPGVPQTACLKCHAKVEKRVQPAQREARRLSLVPQAAHAREHGAGPLPDVPRRQGRRSRRSGRPHSAHAQACNPCHQQHDVRNKKACAECHAPETAARATRQQAPVPCSATRPHGAPPGHGPAWWTRCSAVPRRQGGEREGTRPRPLRVQELPPAPSRSPCPRARRATRTWQSKGLHAAAEAPVELHFVPRSTRPWRRQSRQQCLICHTDRRNHEPTAQRCQACHLFQ